MLNSYIGYIWVWLDCWLLGIAAWKGIFSVGALLEAPEGERPHWCEGQGSSQQGYTKDLPLCAYLLQEYCLKRQGQDTWHNYNELFFWNTWHILHCCFSRPGSLHFDGHQGRAGQLPKPVTRGGDVVVDQNLQSRICNYCILLSGAHVVHLTRGKETTLSFDDLPCLVIFDMECGHRLTI